MFAGGFSLSTLDAVDIASVGVPYPDSLCTRPRRCWLLPYQHQEYAAPRRAHFFLTVLKEEETKEEGGTEFCVYFLDSQPGVWKNLKDMTRLRLFETIKDIAKGSGWMAHRNTDDHVKFRSKPKYVNVAKQRSDRACGFHAWILALGMTPNVRPRHEFNGNIYAELREMISYALAGLLDWRTLVAWLFARDLTVEKTIARVTLKRAFESTVQQQSSDELEEYIGTTRKELDVPLEQLTEEEQPYVNNSVNFASNSWRIENAPELEDEDENEKPKELPRAEEDSDDSDDPGEVHEWDDFFRELV
ncbi:hypothetical protein BU23DRAFT_576027 [Bimuria novae-zelandiae CBS 107.79]|uniref:Ubiquitin-like protease family profile domain-containing protein n=1 Tax=Bimuria novae-zelandiae CBS 107.79 TaxID=1447943 RepID=A0A6A5UGG6_9PLEO|nr:hypothetical protein BU23DRAFT_576027 [Bimuria novae-zelandiae CBS 107.79]